MPRWIHEKKCERMIQSISSEMPQRFPTKKTVIIAEEIPHGLLKKTPENVEIPDGFLGGISLKKSYW